MKFDDSLKPDHSLKPFSRELRRWAKRDIRLSASQARSRVLDAIEDRPGDEVVGASTVPWPRLVTVLAAIVLAVAIWLLIPPAPSLLTPTLRPVLSGSKPETPRTERFLVVTLASGNPLYIQMKPRGLKNFETRNHQP